MSWQLWRPFSAWFICLARLLRHLWERGFRLCILLQHGFGRQNVQQPLLTAC